MTDHKLDLKDGSLTDDAGASDKPAERVPFLVKSESGLFKNGKHHAKDTVIELDPKTAKNFIASGDIEEIPDED